MDLSIIIVNWNSKDYLHKCLASILTETRGLDYEVIVIDTASYDGCDQMLREEYPQVHFIQSTANLGFARANNLAFATSKGKAVLFLNPDTEVCGPAIQVMHKQLMTLPDAGAAGCKLLNSDGTVQTSCIQSFPTVLNQILDSEVLRKRFPRSRLWGMSPLFNDSDKSSEVEAISGACLMMRRSLFKSIGMFSVDYFMYSEDVDLCFKSRHAGFRNYYVPSAVVLHHGGGSTAQNKVSVFSSVMMLESRWRFFLKTRPVWYCWLYRTGMLTISLVRISLVLLLRPAEAIVAKGVQWDAAFQKWRARFRWSVGLEGWARDY